MLARAVVARGEVRGGRAAGAPRPERLQLPLADPAGRSAHGGGQPTRPRRIDCRQWLLRRSRSWCRRTTRPRASRPRCGRCTRRSAGSGSTHEILVVDNASTDGTADVVEALGDPGVRVLRNPENLGKGASLRRGMLEARGALRLHCDADCGPSRARARADGRAGGEPTTSWSARGSRPGADVGRRQPVRRRIAGRSFGLLCRAVLREPTRDLFCGFKLWRAPAAEAVVPRHRADGLDVRRRDARDGARARLRHHRDRDPVDRPRGLAALDAAGDRAGDPRAARGAPARAPRARAARRAAGELVEAAEPGA